MSHPVTGYVLAGGRSSRMGTDKALLELASKPLIQHAVEKLQRVCASTFILSGREELASFAPLVLDLHPGCGPLGGMEAALLHAPTPWSLFLAVDMPFVPVEFLAEWVRRVLLLPEGRVAFFTVDDIPQPTMCMIHREATLFIQSAIEQGHYRVLPVLEGAAQALAEQAGTPVSSVLLQRSIPGAGLFDNLNTPGDFAQAEAQAAAVASYTKSKAEGA